MKLRVCLFVLLASSLPALAAGDDEAPPQPTPVLMRVLDAPVPVKGSDGRCHLVYELELTNFAHATVGIDRLDVIDVRSGNAVASLGSGDVAQRLVVRDKAVTPGSLGVAQAGLVYVHANVDCASMPRVIVHRLAARSGAAGIVETAAQVQLAAPTDLVLDPPLRGSRYIAGDGCCDSTRHVRATLPLNGRALTAQRFAIDWEQLDEQDRIYAGDPARPASYMIYGKPVYAVADARVIAAVDGFPDSPPGALPAIIGLAQADGNHVVLDLGGGRFALYAHLAPDSVAVHAGEQVRRGQVLGRVGTSGNSSEPHLHFQVTDAPSPLASNGLPYLLSHFVSTRRGVSTAAFDQAIVDGKPIANAPVPGPAARERVLPLDLWIVDFP